jgi:hypothetical protein
MSTAPETILGPAWNGYAVATFNGTFDSHAKTGEDYPTISLADLFALEPQAQAKGAGLAFIPSQYADFDARDHSVQRDRGSFVALTGDIDSGNHAPKAVADAIKAFTPGTAHLIYSSAHSRPGDLRWRIVLPLDAPCDFHTWHDAQLAFYAFMAARGIAMDHALARAAQPVYLPNVPAVHPKSDTPLRGPDGKPLYYRRTATPLDAPGLSLDDGHIADGIAALRKQRLADEAERAKIRAEAEARRAAQPRGDAASLIEDFNASNSVATMLEICGYEQSPRNADDWRSPNQTADTFATRIIGSKWVSLSASDTAAGLGTKCAAGCYGDAYDLFVHYKHGGDHKGAFRAIHAERRAASGNVTYPPQFHAEPPEWMTSIPMPDEAPDFDDEAPFIDMPEPGEEEHDRWPEPVDLWSRYEEPELPESLLPLTIDLFARRQASIMGADPAGLAMAALTVCATAIPDCIELQVKRNDPTWREHARLWVALVGPPSRKKTPIFKAAMAPLRTIDNQLMRSYLREAEEYENLSKEDRKGAQKPRQRRLVISDTTIEAAQEVMMDSPDGVLSEQDELSGWFGAMDRYNTKGGGDRAFWLKAFNGGTYNLNRIGRGAKQIPNLSISLLGGIQPEPMRKFAADSVDDGLLQRMLPVILRPSTVGKDIAQDQSALDYDQLVGRLYAMRGYGERLLHFSDGARAIRDRLEREHLDLSNSLESVSPKLAAHYGKHDGIFARMCLVWHCIENAYRDLPAEVSEDTAQRVADFMGHFVRTSAIAFYAGVLGMSAGHEDLVNLAALIVAKGMDEVAARDVQRSGTTLRHVTAEQFRTIAEKMEAFGWLERGEPRPKSNTPRWIVNPRVHMAFAERATAEIERRAAAKQALRYALGVS